MGDILSLNDPVVFDSVSSGDIAPSVYDITYELNTEGLLTEEAFSDGVNQIVNSVDPYSVNEEVEYIDFGSFYSLDPDLPDYAVVYQCDGVDIIFPTSYAEDLFIVDGMIINLGEVYTAGAQISGSGFNTYLSSEITIPTYHSSTWYQYLQSYGQPYRIVDRYINDRGTISSYTRDSVSIEWSGGNPWEGFTFTKIALFGILLVLFIGFVFRKGNY